MEMKTIQELIAAFKEAELTSLALKCDDFELKLGKEMTMNVVPEATSVMQNTTNVMSVDNKAVRNVSLMEAGALESHKCIKSPMVGTFYSASSPGAKPFITVGSQVKKGDVVCVIEAMKLMNEVEAEEDGEVVEILIQNEEMVEYGQPLFILK